MTTPPDAAGEDGVDHPPGERLRKVAVLGTATFVVSSTAGAVFPGPLAAPSAAVAVVLFVVGCGAFLWAYAIAIGRSRTEAIGIGGLYFLAGSGPRSVRRTLLGAFGVQVVAALATASVRPFTSVAFGILVPMYGLGLAGLWGARYGCFASHPPAEGGSTRDDTADGAMT